MLTIEELNEELESLQEQMAIKDQEIKHMKKEVLNQLDMRESELNDYLKLSKKYTELERRYFALKNSTLGKSTILYWRLTRKIKRILKGGHGK